MATSTDYCVWRRGSLRQPSSGCGTIFNINPSGNLTTLYNFCSQANCADGPIPESALLQASDRVLWYNDARRHK